MLLLLRLLFFPPFIHEQHRFAQTREAKYCNKAFSGEENWTRFDAFPERPPGPGWVIPAEKRKGKNGNHGSRVEGGHRCAVWSALEFRKPLSCWMSDLIGLRINSWICGDHDDTDVHQ